MFGIFDRKKTRNNQDKVERNYIDSKQNISDLFKVDAQERDSEWLKSMTSSIVDAELFIKSKTPVEGPDKFPYFEIFLSSIDGPQGVCTIREILDTCLDNGIGIALDPKDEGPAWVFSYGDLWSMHYSVSGLGDVIGTKASGDSLTYGNPSENVLPERSRKCIRQYFNQYGVKAKVAYLVSLSIQPTEILIFDVSPDDFHSKENFEAVMDRLQWYLPKELPSTYTYDDNFLKLVKKLTGEFKVEDYL